MASNIKPILNLTIDIETLGTKPGCVITEVAMKSFSLVEEEQVDFPEEWHCHISVISCLMNHLTVDENTINWWTRPEKAEALEILYSGQAKANSLDYAMKELYTRLTDYAKKYDIYIFGRGVGTFDLPILDYAMRQVIGDSYRTPWQFWQVMDLRSIYRFCEWCGMVKQAPDTKLTNH